MAIKRRSKDFNEVRAICFDEFPKGNFNLAIQYIDERYRAVLTDVCVDDLSYADAAAKVGVGKDYSRQFCLHGAYKCRRVLLAMRAGHFPDADFLHRNFVYIFDAAIDGKLKDCGFDFPSDLLDFLSQGGNLCARSGFGPATITKVGNTFAENGYPLDKYFLLPLDKYSNSSFGAYASKHRREGKTVNELYQGYEKWAEEKLKRQESDRLMGELAGAL